MYNNLLKRCETATTKKEIDELYREVKYNNLCAGGIDNTQAYGLLSMLKLKEQKLEDLK